MTRPARVLLVDDHPAVRHGLLAMLAAEDALSAVGSAASAREALELGRRLRPDVVLLDYNLPDDDGLSLCLRLKTATPTGDHAPRVLLYSGFADEMLTLLGAVSGADGLLSKASLASELCEALRAVAAGTRLLHPPPPETMQTALAGLGPDDLPIVGMLVHGTAPHEIADTLDVDVHWLVARRWAILDQLRGRPGRRAA